MEEDYIIDANKRNIFFEKFKLESNAKLGIKKTIIVTIIIVICVCVAFVISLTPIPVLSFIAKLFGSCLFKINFSSFVIIFFIGLCLSLFLVTLYDKKINCKIENYTEDIGMDLLGAGVANIIIKPIILGIKSLGRQDNTFNENIPVYVEKIKNLMNHSFGFTETYTDFFIESNFNNFLENLSNEVDDLDFNVRITVSSGKKQKEYNRNLTFLIKDFYEYFEEIMKSDNPTILYTTKQNELIESQEKIIYKKLQKKK